MPPAPPQRPWWWNITANLLTTNIGRGVLVLLLYRLYRFTRRRRVQSLEGKLIVVTGAANGIGRALALALAQRGAHVAMFDIDQSALDDSARTIRAAVPGVRLHPARVDLASRDEIVAAARALQQQAGAVHGICNVAGVCSGLPFLSLPTERIEQSVAVNVLAHVWTLQAFLPGMVERNSGHVVAVSSAAGLFGAPLMSDYALSKFAAVGFHESIRLELKKMGKHGVRTTLVCPAHVDTRLFQGYRPGMLQRTLTPQQLALQIVQAMEKSDTHARTSGTEMSESARLVTLRRRFSCILGHCSRPSLRIVVCCCGVSGDEMVLAPWSVGMAYFLRGCLPTWIDDHIKRWTGLTDAMDQWKGKNGS